MFGIDFPELMVIGVVALVVLGPERLPKAARFVGLWVRRARGQWNSVRSELERELAADEFRRTLHDTEKAMRDIDADVRAADVEARREFDAMRKATSASATAAAAEATATATATDPPARAAEPFDSLADFDPYADAAPVERASATASTRAPSTATPSAPPATMTAPEAAAAPPALSANVDEAPRPTSAFSAAAAALSRHQADADLSAAAVMTGPPPTAASLADHSVPDAAPAPAPDADARDADHPPPAGDADRQTARGG